MTAQAERTRNNPQERPRSSDPSLDTREPRNPATRATATPFRLSCSGCTATWTGVSRAHCSACHATFAGVSYFDRHRSVKGEHGSCLDPAGIRDSHGDPVMVFRGGLWGGPEMSEDDKAAVFGRADR